MRARKASSGSPAEQYFPGGRQSSAGGGAYSGLSSSAPYHQLSSGNSSSRKAKRLPTPSRSFDTGVPTSLVM